MLRSWGFTLGDTTSEVLVTGTWSQMTKYVLLAHRAGRRGAPGLGARVGGVGGARADRAGGGWPSCCSRSSCAASASPPGWAPGATGSWAGCRRRVTRIPDPGLTQGLPLFRTQMVRLLRLCWGRLTVTMLVSQLTVVLVLGICVRMQGLDRGDHLVGRHPRGVGAGHLRVAAHPHPGRPGRGRGGARGGARPRAARLRRGGRAGRRAALPHRDLPGPDPDRPGHLPLLADVDVVAAPGELPRPRAPPRRSADDRVRPHPRRRAGRHGHERAAGRGVRALRAHGDAGPAHARRPRLRGGVPGARPGHREPVVHGDGLPRRPGAHRRGPGPHLGRARRRLGAHGAGAARARHGRDRSGAPAAQRRGQGRR